MKGRLSLQEVAVLLSGGVDPSVALQQLVAAGHKCRAFYLRIWLEEEQTHAARGDCPWEGAVTIIAKQAAKKAAEEAEAAKVSSHRSEVSSHRGWEQPQGSPVFSETAAQRAVRRVSQTLRENHARVTDLMEKWDLDGDGKIDRHEFQRAMLKLDVASPADIDATFNLFDEDHSGSIELQELQRLYSQFFL